MAEGASGLARPGVSHPALRIAGGLALGAAVAIATVATVEWVGGLLFPHVPDPQLTIVVAGERALAAMPFAARLLVVAGWCLGTFLGGAAAAAVVRRRWAVWPIAVLIVVNIAETVAGFTHPGWMIAAGLILPWPCAWAAQRFARHR